MCTIETLQTMNSISSLIIKLYASRLNAIGGDAMNLLKQAASMESDNREVSHTSLPDNERRDINDVFRQILSISKEKDRNVKESVLKYLKTLKDIFTDYPGFERLPMQEDLKKQYDTIHINLENRDEDFLMNELASCKETLYKY